ncbi:hypothetical protein ACTA71_000680 [Dictyostelium dimigraforme]
MYSDDNEILFWKVFKNVVLRNLIFKVMGEQVIEYDDIKKYYIGNRVKFSNITSLGWISKKKLWTILKDKLIGNQYLKINKKGLSNFFKYCNEDLETIQLFYKFKKKEINSITDPIMESIENENEQSLKYFLDYIDEETGEKLPITLESIKNGFYHHLKSISMIDILYKELKNLLNNNNNNNNNNNSNNNSNNNKIEMDPLFYSLGEKTKCDMFTYIFENCLDVFLEPKHPSFDPVLFSIYSPNRNDEFRTKLFKSGYVIVKNVVPIFYILNNYSYFSYQDFLFFLKFNYQFNNKQYTSKEVNDIIDKMVENETLNYEENNIEFQKLKFIKYRIAREYNQKPMYIAYFNEFDDKITIETTSLPIIAEYTFSSFSIKGLNYLIETSFRFPELTYISPNLSKLEEIKNRIVPFFKIYFNNDNYLKIGFSCWKPISEMIFYHNFPFEIIYDLIEIFPISLLPYIIEQINNIPLNCISTTVKIIYKIKERRPELISTILYKKENYFKALEFYIKNYTTQQIDDLKFFEDHFKINCGSTMADEQEKLIKYCSLLSFSLKSIDSIKKCLINYPNVPKQIFCKQLYIQSFNNLDIKTIKQLIEINGEELNEIYTNFNFNGIKIDQVDVILNDLIEIKFPTIKSNPNFGISFFKSLFDSFSFKEIIENCKSFKSIDFNLFQSQTLNIIFSHSIKRGQFEFVLFILNQIQSNDINNNNNIDFSDLNEKPNYIKNYISGELIFNDDDPNLIIEILNLFIKKLNAQRYPKSSVFQVLFNTLVKCKNVNFDQINSFLELCNTNSIELIVGIYHIIYYLNIKNIKLSNYLISVYAVGKSIFSKMNKYNGNINFDSKQYSLETIKSLSTFQLLRKLTVVSKPPLNFKYNLNYLFKINEGGLAITSYEKFLKGNVKNFEPIINGKPSILSLLFKSNWFSNISNVIYILDKNLNCLSKFSILEKAISKHRFDVVNLILSTPKYNFDITDIKYKKINK